MTYYYTKKKIVEKKLAKAFPVSFNPLRNKWEVLAYCIKGAVGYSTY